MTGCGVALQGGQDEDPCCLALGIFPLTFTEQTRGWGGGVSPPRTLSKRLKIEIISEGIHTLHRLECQVILTNKFFWSWKKANCSALLWQEKMLLNYRKRDKNWGWKSTDDFFPPHGPESMQKYRFLATHLKKETPKNRYKFYFNN